ncbi:MAG: RluA family pseudouridine synthase [Planctomycetota bacterium]|nr:MAG: RluA family pseudouridine synthase [Planctomycetota bacterium]
MTRPSLPVLYEDNHLLVVAKEAGVPVVPDASGDPSMLEMAKAWVKVRYQKPGEVFLGVVHRLDRPVSGVLLFARTSKAASRLTQQWRQGEVRKCYWGIVEGVPGQTEGEVRHWLYKDRRKNIVEVVSAEREGAKLACTRWRLQQQKKARALLHLEPVTGRSHQLRLACRSLGTPLLGDLKYGAGEALKDRSLALHACALSLQHPTKGETMTFECPPPDKPWWREFCSTTL